MTLKYSNSTNLSLDTLIKHSPIRKNETHTNNAFNAFRRVPRSSGPSLLFCRVQPSLLGPWPTPRTSGP